MANGNPPIPPDHLQDLPLGKAISIMLMAIVPAIPIAIQVFRQWAENRKTTDSKQASSSDEQESKDRNNPENSGRT